MCRKAHFISPVTDSEFKSNFYICQHATPHT